MSASKKKARNCVDCNIEITVKYGFRKPVEETRCGSCAAKRRGMPKGVHALRWNGGKTISTSGYVMVHYPNHPHANNRNYVKRSNLVWEQATGYYPQKGNELHHKDGDKLNDDIGNLELMAHAEHTALHSKGVNHHGPNNPAYKHGKYVGVYAKYKK